MSTSNLLQLDLIEFGSITDSPQGWLERYDRRPRIYPRLPQSARMGLVVLAHGKLDPLDAEAFLTGYVLTDETDVQKLYDSHHVQTGEVKLLFFHVPRTVLIDYIPELSSDAWSS